MLRRKMYERLKVWKASSSHKVFMLLGARQTGKTYIVRAFANSEYTSFIEVNFLEDEQSGSLLAHAESAKDLISRLSLIAGHSIVPGTLVFLDEIQQIGHEVVTLSKFLLDDGRFDVVLSGSLLGTALTGVASFPVGSVVIERMYPLDFEEFCWSSGVPESIINEIREHYQSKKPLEDSLHDRLTRLFRQYMATGGMPEAVQRFFDTNRDLGAAREVASSIAEQYRYDITKYADKRKLQIRAVYDNIPSQLAKENKRFMMMSVRQGATYERLKDDFEWLIDAGVALPTYVVTEPKYPLIRTKAVGKFKLYASDCGILLSQYPQVAAMGIVSGTGDANYGAIYENAVAQQIKAAGFSLYYYHSSRKGEVDFLLETEEGKVLPIEVKSGKDYKLHVALNNLLSTRDFDIECAFVLSENNVSVEQHTGKTLCYLPLYMSMCLGAEKGDGLKGMHLEEISFS